MCAAALVVLFVIAVLAVPALVRVVGALVLGILVALGVAAALARTTASAGTPIRSPHRGLIRSSRNFFGGNAGGSHALPLGSQFQPLLGEIEQHSRVLGAPGRLASSSQRAAFSRPSVRIAGHSAKTAKKAAAEGASESTERMSAPLIGAAVPGPLPRPFGRGTAHNVATSSRLLVESP
jgi:hypothetical protein